MSSKFNSDLTPASRHPAGRGPELTALFVSDAHYCFSHKYHPNFSELHVLQAPTFAVSAAFVTLAGTGQERANTLVVSPAPLARGNTRSPATEHQAWQRAGKHCWPLTTHGGRHRSS